MKDESPFKSTFSQSLAQEQRQQWERIFKDAQKALEAGNVNQALKLFEQAQIIDDRRADLHYQKGRALFIRGDFARAKIAFQTAIDEDIAPLRMLSAMGEELLGAAEKTSTPLVDFPALIEANYRQQGHSIPGSEWFLDHVHPTIEGHKQLALVLFQQLVELDIVKPGADWGSDQIEAVSQSLIAKVDPDVQQRALLNLAKVTGWAGKLEEAHRILLHCQSQFGDSFNTITMLGKSAIRLERKEDALNYFKQALAIKPDDILAAVRVAEQLHEMGRLEEAAIEYQSLIQRKPDSMPGRIALSEILVNLGRIEEAIIQYQAILQLDPSSAEGHLNLGVIFSQQNKRGIAAEHFRKALAIDPDLAYAHFGLAIIADQSENLPLAIEHYQLALKLNNNDAETHNNLGILFARTGRLNEAIEHLSEAVTIAPDYQQARYNLQTAKSELKKSQNGQ